MVDMQASEYESGTQNQVSTGLLLLFDTSSADSASGPDFDTFDVKCYPAGTWPLGVAC